MDKQTAINKIRKCLALAAGAGGHEAAAALRQAHALMKKFNVCEQQIRASAVHEARTRASAIQHPAAWENGLAHVVARAFDCSHLFVADAYAGQWSFIGGGPAPEVAQYAFAVLLRQLKRERLAFIKRECRRLKPASKTRRADFFCLAWVQSVARQVQDFSRQGRNDAAIVAYLEQTYGAALTELRPRNRSDGAIRARDWDAIDAGVRAGENAQLHQGVQRDDQRLIGG